ncbi:response regulator [Methylobacterium sp. MA0201]|uniref:response regulator n=1 Tax=Methylobacterium alsaeris TaxID=3344826 RepID=UPI003757E139
MPQPIVLVVEDEPFLRMDAVDIVESAGFAAIEAPHADAAIEILIARQDIAVVLTDIEMPGSMNGIGLAHAVRDGWPTIRVVVLSGRLHPKPQDLPAGVRFIAKPFRPAQIEEALRPAT